MNSRAPITVIDKNTLPLAVNRLVSRSEIMRRIVEEYGQPRLWSRDPGFASLVYTVLEQQVSLASARAVYDRLLGLSGELSPKALLGISDADLRSIGFSRQKTGYCRDIASRIASGDLDLGALANQSDDEVRDVLTAIKGVGPWTADVYLLHSLGRPDVWPVGDLALAVAVGEEMGLLERPDATRLEEVGEEFRPLRSVAARIFWQGYLARRGVSSVS